MIATLTPSRGDRPELLAFCKEQIGRQTIKPDATYFIDYTPVDDQFDLTERIRRGFEYAKKDGHEIIFILEDDDGIPDDYIERYLPHFKNADFVGDNKTCYYNIKSLRWHIFNHERRSSLFTTAFRISAMDDFRWPAGHKIFLDIDIWQHAINKKRAFTDSGAIGIKHGQGKCGGKGHFMSLENHDPDMNFLKSKLSSRHIEFYGQYRRSLEAITVR